MDEPTTNIKPRSASACHRLTIPLAKGPATEKGFFRGLDVVADFASRSADSKHRGQFDHRNLRNIVIVLCFILFCASSGNDTALRPSTPNKYSGKAPAQRVSHRREPYKPTQSIKGEDNPGDDRGCNKARDSGENGDDDDNNDRAPERPRRRNKRAHNGRYLACPFFKRDPILNINCLLRNCLRETAFVIQHLQRSHASHQIFCQVCGQTFSTPGECDDHVQQQACQQQVFHYEGLSVTQLDQLRGNDRRRLSEVDRWYCVWDIVFPNTPRPDSPYVGQPLEELVGLMRRYMRSSRLSIAQTSLTRLRSLHHAGSDRSQSYDITEIYRIVEVIESVVFGRDFLTATTSLRNNLVPLASDHSSHLAQDLPLGTSSSLETRIGNSNQQELSDGQPWANLDASSQVLDGPISPISRLLSEDYEQIPYPMTGVVQFLGEGSSVSSIPNTIEDIGGTSDDLVNGTDDNYDLYLQQES